MLPAEDLADLVLPVEEGSSARRDELHVAGLLDVADGARGVFEAARAPAHHAFLVISSWKVCRRSVGSEAASQHGRVSTPAGALMGKCAWTKHLRYKVDCYVLR